MVLGFVETQERIENLIRNSTFFKTMDYRFRWCITFMANNKLGKTETWSSKKWGQMPQNFSSKSSVCVLITFDQYSNFWRNRISTRSIKTINFRKFHSFERKMVELVSLILLNELLDFDDEKPTRGPTRDWVKRRREKGY